MSAAALLWLGLLCRAPAPGAKPAPKPEHPDVPVQVRCDDMVVENRQALARCEGHVVAVRQNVTVTCNRAVAHYDEAGRVNELTCLGNVHVVKKPLPAAAGAAAPATPPPPTLADGDKGVYLEAARTLTLTGHASVEQGADRLAGEPIVFYVDEDRVVSKRALLAGRVQDVANDSAAKPKAAQKAGASP